MVVNFKRPLTFEARVNDAIDQSQIEYIISTEVFVAV